MDHHQFYQHDQFVRRNREAFNHVVGRAPAGPIVAAPVSTSAAVAPVAKKSTTAAPVRNTVGEQIRSAPALFCRGPSVEGLS